MNNSTPKLEDPEYNPTDLALSIPAISSKILLFLDRKSFPTCRLLNKEWNSKVESVYAKYPSIYLVATKNKWYPRLPPPYPTFMTKRISFLHRPWFSTKEDAATFLESCRENVESIHVQLNSYSEQNLNVLKAISRNQYCPQLKELSVTICREEIGEELRQGLESVSHLLNHLILEMDIIFSLNIPVFPVLKTVAFFPKSFAKLKLDYEGYGGFVGFLNAKFPNLVSLLLANEVGEYISNRRIILHSEIFRSTERHEKLKKLVIPKPRFEEYYVKIKEMFPNLQKLVMVEGHIEID